MVWYGMVWFGMVWYGFIVPLSCWPATRGGGGKAQRSLGGDGALSVGFSVMMSIMIVEPVGWRVFLRLMDASLPVAPPSAAVAVSASSFNARGGPKCLSFKDEQHSGGRR